MLWISCDLVWICASSLRPWSRLEQILADFVSNCTFPVLGCNVDVSNEPRLKGLIRPYVVLALPYSGKKVGVVGITTVTTPETAQPGKRS